MEIKFFKKDEIVAVIAIFIFLIVISVPNFNMSFKRARDAQRRDALGKITDFLKEFRAQNAFYPFATSDNKIIGCNPQISGETTTFFPCKWDYKYADEFRYESTGDYYQLLAYLEVTEPGSEYREEVFKRKILCGENFCNTGRTTPYTPLDIGLEEYQNRLNDEQRSTF